MRGGAGHPSAPPTMCPQEWQARRIKFSYSKSGGGENEMKGKCFLCLHCQIETTNFRGVEKDRPEPFLVSLPGRQNRWLGQLGLNRTLINSLRSPKREVVSLGWRRIFNNNTIKMFGRSEEIRGHIPLKKSRGSWGWAKRFRPPPPQRLIKHGIMFRLNLGQYQMFMKCFTSYLCVTLFMRHHPFSPPHRNECSRGPGMAGGSGNRLVGGLPAAPWDR